MKLNRLLVIAATLVIVMVVSAIFAHASAQDSYQCNAFFGAEVTSGPDAGLVIQGIITLTVESSGESTGTLILEDGSEIGVTGQVMGRSLDLVFDLGNGNYIVGHGTSVNHHRECNGFAGGPLLMVNSGSTGYWGQNPSDTCLFGGKFRVDFDGDCSASS